METRIFKIHLDKRSKKTKEKVYNYYYIAQSYRDENGVSRKRRLHKLGSLSDDEANTYKMRIKAYNSTPGTYTSLNDISCFGYKSYLDVALISMLFNKFFPDNIFDHLLARILLLLKNVNIFRLILPYLCST